MPAMVRRTGKPSPSWPAGAVAIASTGRSVSPRPAPATRGRVRVSAVTAAIVVLLISLHVQLYSENRRGVHQLFHPASASADASSEPSPQLALVWLPSGRSPRLLVPPDRRAGGARPRAGPPALAGSRRVVVADDQRRQKAERVRAGADRRVSFGSPPIQPDDDLGQRVGGAKIERARRSELPAARGPGAGTARFPAPGWRPATILGARLAFAVKVMWPVAGSAPDLGDVAIGAPSARSTGPNSLR